MIINIIFPIAFNIWYNLHKHKQRCRQGNNDSNADRPDKEPVMAGEDAKKKRIGEMLVAGGMIKEDQLARALEEQKKRGGKKDH